jgi:hypothetical protein
MPGLSEFTQSFFEASSKAWKKNKVKYDQACYKYKNKVFPIDTEMPPPPVQSKASMLATQKEILKRQSLQEEAPLPTRRSPRLRAQQIAETYSS